MIDQAKISVIHAGLFKLDGGAMFGVVPKKLWERLVPADDNNLCTWSMRCILVEIGDSKILVDAGMGSKQDEKFRSHFHPHGDQDLLSSLKDQAVNPEEITDVFLTHLHFDHCGGALSQNEKGELIPTFPNATYWTNKAHYDWAIEPNPRERASFLKENFVPLLEQDRLKFLDLPTTALEWLESPWGESIQYSAVYGHTEAMMPLKIVTASGLFVFPADLLPSYAHIGMPYVMGYDIRPLETLKEKEKFFTQIIEEDMRIIFEHDALHETCSLTKNERGRIIPGEFGLV